MRGRLVRLNLFGILISGNNELVFSFSGEQATVLTFIVRTQAMA